MPVTSLELNPDKFNVFVDCSPLEHLYKEYVQKQLPDIILSGFNFNQILMNELLKELVRNSLETDLYGCGIECHIPSECYWLFCDQVETIKGVLLNYIDHLCKGKLVVGYSYIGYTLIIEEVKCI